MLHFTQFKPEFLNRIDEQVIFNRLSKENLRGIVEIEANRLGKRLEERSIKIELTDAALDYLSDVGYDPNYGARPLKRTIQRELETNIARGILKGDFDNGDTIVISVENDRLKISKPTDAIIEEKISVKNGSVATSTKEEDSEEALNGA